MFITLIEIFTSKITILAFVAICISCSLRTFVAGNAEFGIQTLRNDDQPLYGDSSNKGTICSLGMDSNVADVICHENGNFSRTSPSG